MVLRKVVICTQKLKYKNWNWNTLVSNHAKRLPQNKYLDIRPDCIKFMYAIETKHST